LLEPFLYQMAGAVQLPAAKGDVPEPDGLEPHRRERNEVRRVDRDSSVVVAAESGNARHVQVLGRLTEDSGQPAAVQAVVGRRERGVGHPVDPEEFGRDALAKAHRVLGIGEERALRMGVRIDEAWRNHVSGRVDDPAALRPPEVPDSRDRLADHADVGPVPRRTGAIDHRAVRDHEIEGHDTIVSSRGSRVSRSCPVAVTRTGSPSAT
jgi:hypothetical protein